MDSKRVERAARALLGKIDASYGEDGSLVSVSMFDSPDACDAVLALRAAMDAAQEPAQAGSFVCERGGCGKNGRVDPYGAGPDCKSGGLSPAGSEPATATTIKPSAGGA